MGFTPKISLQRVLPHCCVQESWLPPATALLHWVNTYLPDKRVRGQYSCSSHLPLFQCYPKRASKEDDTDKHQHLHTPANTVSHSTMLPARQVPVIPGTVFSRGALSPSFFWGTTGKPWVWWGRPCFPPCSLQVIIPWVPAAPSPMGRDVMKWAPHHLGWGRGQPSAKQWQMLEAPRAPGFLAAPQLRGGFVHWNIRPGSHL